MHPQILWSDDKLVVPLALKGSTVIKNMNTIITPIATTNYYCALLKNHEAVTTCKECLKKHISDPLQIQVSMIESSGGVKCKYTYNVTVVCNGNPGHVNNHAGSCTYELVFQAKQS